MSEPVNGSQFLRELYQAERSTPPRRRGVNIRTGGEMNTAALTQRTQAWRDARLGHVTASGFDKLITPLGKPRTGETPKTYLLELLGEYATGLPASDYESPAMRWGNEWEDEARNVYGSRRDMHVNKAGFELHQSIPRVGCSPDGLIGDSGLVEIKCPFTTKEHIRTALAQAVPDQYVAQVQGQLWVTNRTWLDFASYDPRIREESLRLVVVPVDRDESFIAKLESTVRDFVVGLLQGIEQLAEMREVSGE